jgi:hypothetical protein
MLTIAVHGTSGALSRVAAEIFPAASPMISMQRITANSVFLSYSNPTRVSPATKLMASSAASIMCSSRIRASGGVLDDGLTQNLVAKMMAQFAWRSQIDSPSAHHHRQFRPHFRKADQSRLHAALEFDWEVDIAVGIRRAPGMRTEKRKSPDMVVTAVDSQAFGNGQRGRVHGGWDDKAFQPARKGGAAPPSKHARHELQRDLVVPRLVRHLGDAVAEGQAV